MVCDGGTFESGFVVEGLEGGFAGASFPVFGIGILLLMPGFGGAWRIEL